MAGDYGYIAQMGVRETVEKSGFIIRVDKK
jgi:hypothetical protein